MGGRNNNVTSSVLTIADLVFGGLVLLQRHVVRSVQHELGNQAPFSVCKERLLIRHVKSADTPISYAQFQYRGTQSPRFLEHWVPYHLFFDRINNTNQCSATAAITVHFHHFSVVESAFAGISCVAIVRRQNSNRFKYNTRMWANAQPDGRPAEHRWHPLFNAAKFG